MMCSSEATDKKENISFKIGLMYAMEERVYICITTFDI